MDFSFSNEQSSLRDSVTGYLGRKPDQPWRVLAGELGIAGALLPSARGGQGGGSVEMMIIMEALGAALSKAPFVETAVMGALLLDRLGGAEADAVLPSLAAGEIAMAIAWAEPDGRYAASHVETKASRTGGSWVLSGRKSMVLHAASADIVLVSARTAGATRDTAGISLFSLRATTEGVRRHDFPTIDGRMASELILADVRLAETALIGEEGGAWPALDLAIDTTTVALAAESVGIMRRLHEETLAYAKQRRQFGKAIAEFQVIQHRLVDMFIAIERAVSAVYLAVLKLDSGVMERALAVSTAKATINKACRFVGQSAIQIHGGMGMVDELAAGRLFKRLTAIENSFGTTDHHLARHAALSRKAA